jgi:hypothetical protein
MQRIFLDFQRSPRRIGWLGLLLLALGLAATVRLATDYHQLSGEASLWEAKKAAEERHVKRRPVVTKGTPKESALLGQQIEQANDVITQLSLPWDVLFSEVEAVNPDQVALLAIEPDAQKNTVKISGEAKDFGAMLSYMKFLSGKGSFTDVYLQSHQTHEQLPRKPIRFALIAAWTKKANE